MDSITTYSSDLEVLTLPGTDPHGPHVMLLHGYGANAQDLYAISQMVQAPKNTTWLFPNAPHLVHFAEAEFSGRSWFSLDLDEVERLMSARCYDEFSTYIPKDLDYARNLIENLLRKIQTPLSNIIIGGFSQGAILATEVALSLKENLGGLAVFSGTLINESCWKKQAATKRDLPFFQSHGLYDSILHVDLARKLESLFLDAGMIGKLEEFEDAHTIPHETLASFSTFISKYLH